MTERETDERIAEIEAWYDRQFPMTGDSVWPKLLNELLTALKSERAARREAERMRDKYQGVLVSANKTAERRGEKIKEAEAECERLRGIVDKLPHTADGVPAVPGMTIWPVHEVEDEMGATVKIYAEDNGSGELLEHGSGQLRIGKCYSVRQN